MPLGVGIGVMKAPIAIQLYSVREAMSEDFEGVLAQIAEMGYAGVETATFPGTTPERAGRIFKELGLKVASAHLPLPLGDKKSEVLDTMEAIDCDHLVCPWMDPHLYQSRESMKGLADKFNEAKVIAAERGMRFSIHNHWFEMEPVEGRPAYQTLMEYLDADVLFQIDTYWAEVAGLSAPDVVRELGARTPLLHLKDGPATRHGDMTALGEGVIDIPAIVAAGGSHTEWLIVELDRCATDMLEAVRKSYKYMISNGLARGNR